MCLFSVDATAESGKLGRLVNHSRVKYNCVTRVVEVDGQPRLILAAARDIAVNEELLYDYGDRSKESLEAYPWLASWTCTSLCYVGFTIQYTQTTVVLS